METYLILIIVVLIVGFAITWTTGLTADAESNRETQRREREIWSQEKIMSYEQVQEEREKLIHTLEVALPNHPKQLSQLINIVNDWADLKIKTIQERRSWVRSPDKD